VGFDPAVLINIEFVRAEHRRLADLPFMFSRDDVASMVRPPLGFVV
jgi:hypothetical protein